MPATATVRAAIYARISDDRAGDAGGVTRQIEDCRALAQQKGWVVATDDELVDNDLSAFSGRDRPAYAALLQALRERRVDAVIVWHPDRLHRSVRDLEDFIDVIEAAKARVATVKAGDLDLTTAGGRQNARLVGVIARGESERMGDRIRRKHLQLATDGEISGGGTRPFGYENDRKTVNVAEAALIRKAVDAVIAGRPVRSIARDWATLGVRSPRGNEFGPNAVRRLLRSGRIAGLREHHGEIVGKAVWPAIVPPAKAAAVRAILSDPARLSRRAARKYLLAGFLTCGLCSAVMRSRPRTAGTPAYTCKAGPGAKGCGRIGIVAGPLEARIAELVFYRADSPKLAAAIKAKHRTSDESQYAMVAEDEAMLATLADDFAAKRVTRAEWLRARDAVQARLDAARQQLGKQNGTAALAPYAAPGQLQKAWAGMDLDSRRAVLGALIQRIVVAPASRTGAPADGAGRRIFDPRRVTVEWRF